MPKPVEKEKIQFIIDNYLNYASRELASKIGITRTTVSKVLKRHNLKAPIELIKLWQKRRVISKPYTEKEKQYIIDTISIKSIKQIAKDLKRCNAKLRVEIKDLGLCHIVEAKVSASRIQPGNSPPNKGKKMHEYMNETQMEVFKANQFKKGNVPHNTNKQGNGAVVSRKGANGRINKYFRISLGVWEFHQRVIWNEANGEIPDNHKIIFKDGNSENTSLENLKLITSEESMLRNSKHNYPDEIIPSMVLIKKLEKQLNKLQNG